MDYTGVQEWTAKEYKEREGINSRTPRSIVSVTRGKLADEFIISEPNLKSDSAVFAYHTSALNAVLAWLDFPYKLRQFVESLIALSGNNSCKPFTATNLEIGKQFRIGRAANSAAIQKTVSRHKSEMLEWQNALSFDLIGIERGRFNAAKRKNDPTTYTPFIQEWIPEIVCEASSSPEWIKGEKLRQREIRRVAKEYLLRLQNCPPLRGHVPKTLSEEEKFDRADRMLDSIFKTQLNRVERAGFAPEVYSKYRALRLGQQASNPIGVVGNLLTPEKDEPQSNKSIWQLIKTGEINDEIEAIEIALDDKLDLLDSVDFNRVEYAVKATAGDEKNIPLPRIWEGGKWRETNNDFTTGHREDIASDNIQNPENDACKLLIPLTHDRTFLGNIDGTISDDEIDFSDWKTDAEETGNLSIEQVGEKLKFWFAKIAEKVPDKFNDELWNGAWQIYWGELFDSAAKEAEINLNLTAEAVSNGQKTIDELRAAALDYVMAHLYYFQNGVRVPQSKDKLNRFRARLDKFVQRLPDG